MLANFSPCPGRKLFQGGNYGKMLKNYMASRSNIALQRSLTNESNRRSMKFSL